MKIGKSTGCHQLAERSFSWKGYQFPICARCTGLLCGYIIGLIIYIWIKISLEMCCCMCMIMFLDWHLQYMGLYESTNIRRLCTGIICGIGYIHIIAQIVESLFYLFK